MRPSRLSAKAAVGALAFLAATAAAGAAPARAAPQLTVFGDSYSIPVHDGSRDWPLQLRDPGIVGQVNDFASSGATASSRWHINFAQQIRAGERAGRPLGLTVVYLGYNDIGGDTASSAPATWPGSRPWSTPGRPRAATASTSSSRTTSAARRSTTARRQRSTLRQDTVAWDAFVASTARRFHATVVDVFAAVDAALRAPRPLRLHQRHHRRPRPRRQHRPLRRRLPLRLPRPVDHRPHDRRPPRPLTQGGRPERAGNIPSPSTDPSPARWITPGPTARPRTARPRSGPRSRASARPRSAPAPAAPGRPSARPRSPARRGRCPRRCPAPPAAPA